VAGDAVREFRKPHLRHKRERPAVHTHQPGCLGIFLGVGAEPGVHAPENNPRLTRTGYGERVGGEVPLYGGEVSVGDGGVAELSRVTGNGYGEISGPGGANG